MVTPDESKQIFSDTISDGHNSFYRMSVHALVTIASLKSVTCSHLTTSKIVRVMHAHMHLYEIHTSI